MASGEWRVATRSGEWRLGVATGEWRVASDEWPGEWPGEWPRPRLSLSGEGRGGEGGGVVPSYDHAIANRFATLEQIGDGCMKNSSPVDRVLEWRVASGEWRFGAAVTLLVPSYDLATGNRGWLANFLIFLRKLRLCDSGLRLCDSGQGPGAGHTVLVRKLARN